MSMRNSIAWVAVCVIAGAGVVAHAEATNDEQRYKSTAEIRITLPAEGDETVSISPSAGRILLDLPGGSIFPLDFAASSGGMLRGGEVVSDGNRVKLELSLARGLLDSIDYEPEAIVLRFKSRFDANGFVEVGEQYSIGPEDVIAITVHNFPDLDAELTVSRSGYITAPLVSEVKAEGLSPSGLARKLSELLGSDYLVDPQVDVSVSEYKSQWVMVDGEARSTGRIPLKGGTRLKEVLSEAGGFAETAGERITISRKIEGSDKFQTMNVERREFEAGDVNPLLVHGDIITVAEADYCYLQGEVASPTRVRIERGLTLLQAVTQAGGLTDWANRKRVRVLSEGDAPRVFNLKRIQAGKTEDPLLRGGDIIIVERRFF